MRPEALSELQIDAIREMGSIGAGHAATALAQITGRPVGIEVPEVRLLPVIEVPRALGGPETLIGAVFSRLLGEVSGSVLFAGTRGALLGLVDLLHNRPIGSTKTLGSDEESIITQTGFVLITAYLTAIGRLADLTILPSRPAFAFDMSGAVLDAIAADVGMKADTAILVQTAFSTEEERVDAVVLYMPDPDSLEVVLGRLGVV
ncbi:chemotaxis protein CheC [Coriobacteriia bacterium Es71-Z0120]|uniref:chemotaxis protein CheC n=1 Tax=Parvivirga hydrogeniphila TaxID=2939460 RepID=UPI002260F3FF|nr:chemotaxis protein CheC [Parvivirga hydrogeniphila]MCL4078474.1 chemotaxis protein CheC [Parvivirga hydrogeniphila]